MAHMCRTHTHIHMLINVSNHVWVDLPVLLQVKLRGFPGLDFSPYISLGPFSVCGQPYCAQMVVRERTWQLQSRQDQAQGENISASSLNSQAYIWLYFTGFSVCLMTFPEPNVFWPENRKHWCLPNAPEAQVKDWREPPEILKIYCWNKREWMLGWMIKYLDIKDNQTNCFIFLCQLYKLRSSSIKSFKRLTGSDTKTP